MTTDIRYVQPLLQARALTRRFGGLTAVKAVSIALHIGELHAVIGTDGAGKSTLINMLSGEIAASEGVLETRRRRRHRVDAATARARRHRPQLPGTTIFPHSPGRTAPPSPPRRLSSGPGDLAVRAATASASPWRATCSTWLA